MGHLGTSVISHEGWIAQGAEHPEYQVEGLLQAGCESFDVTTVASPEAALHLQGRAGGASPQNCLWLIQYQLSQGYIAGHPPDFTKCSGCHLMRVKLKTSLMTPVLADLPVSLLTSAAPALLVTLWHTKDQTQPGEKCKGLDAHQHQQKQKAWRETGVHWEEFLNQLWQVQPHSSLLTRGEHVLGSQNKFM